LQVVAVIGMQDMALLGIICPLQRCHAKGKHGMVVHLDQVPARSERNVAMGNSFVRITGKNVVVAKKGREKEVEKIFEKWDLNVSHRRSY
jgi:phosphoribosylformylglycinamidine synthase